MKAKQLLSAVLIVRDEEPRLADCLASLAGIADEIVVVDTGSTDASVEIACAHGAQVLHHPWAGSFAESRNVGLAQARGAWILSIDADERVRPLARECLVARLEHAPEVALRVLLRPFARATPYLAHRLWRNDDRIRFRGVMHERVVEAIHLVASDDGRPIGDWPGLTLDHVGYEGSQTVKHLRNLPLLERQLRLEPHNIFDWRHLARVLRALGREDDADRALEQAVALERANVQPSRDGSLAWADLVRLRHQRGADVRALLEEGRNRWPEQWLLAWIEGVVHLEAGRPEPGAECFRRLLAVDVAVLPSFGIAYDERIFGEYAAASLGLALFRLERFAEAASAYAEAERLAPAHGSEYRAKSLLALARENGAARR